jgi:serine/threonine-protein kinase
MAMSAGIAVAAIALLLWQRTSHEDQLSALEAKLESIQPVTEPEHEAEAVEEVAVAAAELAARAEPGLAAPEPVADDTVALAIRTNVDAVILDAADMGAYGNTNQGDGVQLERSDQPLALILRAPGYLDHEMAVTPDESKSVDIELVPEPSKPGRTRPRGSKAKKSAPPIQKPAKKSNSPKSIDDSKLVDPWKD